MTGETMNKTEQALTEAVAKALYEWEVAAGYEPARLGAHHHSQATAAIATIRAHDEQSAQSIDALLDSVHPKAHVSYVLPHRDEWRACVRWPAPDEDRDKKRLGWVGYPQIDSIGFGPTRMDAIRNAVAQATTTQEGTSE